MDAGKRFNIRRAGAMALVAALALVAGAGGCESSSRSLPVTRAAKAQPMASSSAGVKSEVRGGTSQSMVQWVGPGQTKEMRAGTEGTVYRQQQELLAARQRAAIERESLARRQEDERRLGLLSQRIEELQAEELQRREEHKKLEEQVRRQQAQTDEQREMIQRQNETLARLGKERDRLAEEKKREEEAWARQQADTEKRRAEEQRLAEQWKQQEEKRLVEAKAELEKQRQAVAGGSKTAAEKETGNKAAAVSKPIAALPTSAPAVAGSSLGKHDDVAQLLVNWSKSRCEYELLARQYEDLDRAYNSKSGDGQTRSPEQLKQMSGKLAELHLQMRAASKQSIEHLLKLSGIDSASREKAARELLGDPSLPKEMSSQIATLVGN